VLGRVGGSRYPDVAPRLSCDVLERAYQEDVRKVAAKLADHGAMLNELLRVAGDGAMTLEMSPS